MRKGLLYSKTRSWLAENGYELVQKVETWNPFAKRSQDLFGFVDFLAVSAEKGTLALQVTTYQNRSARKKKIIENKQIALTLIQAGWRVAILAWKKQGRQIIPDFLEITYEVLSGGCKDVS